MWLRFQTTASVPPKGGFVVIDKYYKFPIALQINRATRKKMARLYYDNTKFLQVDCKSWHRYAVKQWMGVLEMVDKRAVEVFLVAAHIPAGLCRVKDLR